MTRVTDLLFALERVREQLAEARRNIQALRAQNTTLETSLDIALAEAEYWRQRTIWACKELNEILVDYDRTDFIFPDGEVIDLEETE